MSLPANRFQISSCIPGGYVWEEALRVKDRYCSFYAVVNTHTKQRWTFFDTSEARRFAGRANNILNNTRKEPDIEELLESYTLTAKDAPGLDVTELQRHNLPLQITLYRCRE